MSTMSTDVRRRRRRGIAGYGITIITITLVVLVVAVIGHQVGSLYSNVSQGLSL